LPCAKTTADQLRELAAATAAGPCARAAEASLEARSEPSVA
jgi:hypothetical protein